jgi:hypothetical protein
MATSNPMRVAPARLSEIHTELQAAIRNLSSAIILSEPLNNDRVAIRSEPLIDTVWRLRHLAELVGIRT